MSDNWYEAPYETGAPVRVDGFPRPLFPPDANQQGKTPSVDGPDCEAYKRVVCRAGRWGDWNPEGWDDSYSNGFAHGKGGNVKDTGVAGVQRQQGIGDSGWLGQATFDVLRAIRVPDGPHRGEMCMDAVAVRLINKAWARFGGGEQPTAKLTRKAMPSPNYSLRSGARVRLIVLHTAEGATSIESLGNYFANANANVSSHVGIDDKPGVVGEYVKRANKAWTAANANPVAVQAELCAFASWSLTEWDAHAAMLENCARWIAEEAAFFKLPITKLSPAEATSDGRGACQHRDLGAWGGSHWDCGGSFPIDRVLARARQIAG